MPRSRKPKQALLPFTRVERAKNNGSVLGRPKKKEDGKKKGAVGGASGGARMPHVRRAGLKMNSALHVTVKVQKKVRNLRHRKRFNVVKAAFVRFCLQDGFRLVQFSVQTNHAHFIVEADSARALSMGMQKMLHSISRRLNALAVVEAGGVVRRGVAGGYRAADGWIGRVFLDRYHAEPLSSPTRMGNALNYVIGNSDHHAGDVRRAGVDSLCSLVASIDDEGRPTTQRANGYLLRREFQKVAQWWTEHASAS